MLKPMLNEERPLIPSFSLGEDDADLKPGTYLGPTASTEAEGMMEKAASNAEASPIKEVLRQRRRAR